ncbi:hypothetical protein AMIS_20850 [Actinoplanes missouriensis 431]|uniref:Uncharacterized protein n=1 Tax=Actinoplanes missouriensis (strain ATCC 14538 / DSM 43046 / CBS 188.64 / JCM 3121 / NBRC 102363 / NCIMB 12654 / NRRL B-3342 / UNCC 431) TaxID=512565 RepID=I0H2R8_ACTM4|nr:hypothetical protein AMIS_20850 [Actinoplanes missouriensis 431]
MVQAQALIRAGRLADPDEHFPYKHEAVTALVAENPPAGPNGDDSKRVSDYMSQRIADASEQYIAAQAAYLGDPGDGTLAAYQAATDALISARKAHRRQRGGAMFIAGQGA